MSESSIARPHSVNYWVSLPRGGKKRIAEQAKVSRVHAWAAFNKRWNPGIHVANELSKATEGKVSPEDLILTQQVYRLGIDAGTTTGWSLIHRESRSLIQIGEFHYAERPVRGKGGWFDAKSFSQVIDSIDHFCVVAYIEMPAFVPGKGIKTVAAQYDTLGCIRAILTERSVPMNWVNPATWKRKAGLWGRGKKASIELAKSLYPGLETDSVDIAESVLISHFG